MATNMIPDPLDPTKMIPAIDEEQLADWTVKKAAAEKARDAANTKRYIPIWSEFTKGIDIMLSPKAETDDEMSMAEAIQFYYKLTVIPFVISVVLTLLAYSQGTISIYGYSIMAILESYVLIYALVYWALTPAAVLIISYPYHLLGKLLLFDGDYKNTFAAFIYMLVPATVFGWAPNLMRLMPNVFDANGILAVSIILGLWALWVFDGAIANLQDTGRFAPIALLVLFGLIIFTVLYFIIPFGI
jgi:hypothetical protein